MHHDPSDLGSLILIQITPKQCIILEDDTDTHMHVKLQITLAHIADILSVFFFKKMQVVLMLKLLLFSS